MIDLEAIRKRNEERNRSGGCGCTWGNGGIDEVGICPHDHHYTVVEDIDSLLNEIERLRKQIEAEAEIARVTRDLRTKSTSTMSRRCNAPPRGGMFDHPPTPKQISRVGCVLPLGHDGMHRFPPPRGSQK